MKHLSGVDSVELKLTVGEADRVSTINSLEMDPLDAEIRQVVFFDTKDLTLDKAGIVVRTRRIQRRPADSVIKLRPVDPGAIPAKERTSPSFSLELDVMPTGFVCSGSMKNLSINDADVKEVLSGRKPIKKLFSKEQRALFASRAPEGIDLDSLSILGPITVLKLKFGPQGFSRKLVAEVWFYPDGSRILELSTKCAPNDAMLAARETMNFLTTRGVKAGVGQSTKTRSALEFFSKTQS